MIYKLYFFTKLVKEAKGTKDHLPTTSLQTPLRTVPVTLKWHRGGLELPRATVLEPESILTAPARGRAARGQQAAPANRHLSAARPEHGFCRCTLRYSFSLFKENMI